MSLIGGFSHPGQHVIWIDLASDPPQARHGEASIDCAAIKPGSPAELERALHSILGTFKPERTFPTRVVELRLLGSQSYSSRFGPQALEALRAAGIAAGATVAIYPLPVSAAVAVYAGLALAALAAWALVRAASS